MGKCNQCKCLSIESATLPNYQTEMGGIKLVLSKSVIEEKCNDCGEVTYTIPNTKGLIAAAAIFRATMPIKLNGVEIRFLRKALDHSSKSLAEILGVTVETMSRWENNKAPISDVCEKLLRASACLGLQERAPLISFYYKKIFDMKIKSVRPCTELVMAFTLVKTKNKGDDKLEDVYVESKAA